MKIEISEETREFLDNWLYEQGAEAWFTAQVKLDLSDYDGAIKSMANHISYLRALSDDRLDYKEHFENAIRLLRQR